MSNELERIRQRMSEAIDEARAIERVSSGPEPGLASPEGQVKEILALEEKLRQTTAAAQAQRMSLEDEKRALEQKVQTAEAGQRDFHHRLELMKAYAEEIRERLVRSQDALEASQEALKGSQESSRRELDRLQAALAAAAADSARLQAHARAWACARTMMAAEIQQLRADLAVFNRPFQEAGRILQEKLRKEHEEKTAALTKGFEEALAKSERDSREKESRLRNLEADLEKRLAAARSAELRLQDELARPGAEKPGSEARLREVEGENRKLRELMREERALFEKEKEELERLLAAARRSKPPPEAGISPLPMTSLEEDPNMGVDFLVPLSPSETTPPPEAGADRSPEPVPGAYPTLQDALDPAWAKLVSVLKTPLSNALGHMRRLAGSRLPQGALALLRLAAAELTGAQDSMKAWAQFLDETGPAPEAGKVESQVERALASWEPVLRKRRITVLRKGQKDLPPVRLHAESLRVALFQILRNAYEAMPSGGMLTVHMTRAEDSGGVDVVFSDTGSGFSDEALSAAFTPFYSSKPGRLGVGLALVRRTLRGYGGEADAANAQKGARVVLRFPPAAEPPPALADGLMSDGQ